MNKLTLPNQFIFSVNLPVRIDDINYAQHLGHDSLISILHEARALFLKHHHLSEINIFGISCLMSALSVEYKSQAFHGDVLTIELAVHPVSKTSIECFQLVTNKKTKREVARVKTKLTFFDYMTQKVQPIPQGFLDLIKL